MVSGPAPPCSLHHLLSSRQMQPPLPQPLPLLSPLSTFCMCQSTQSCDNAKQTVSLPFLNLPVTFRHVPCGSGSRPWSSPGLIPPLTQTALASPALSHITALSFAVQVHIYPVFRAPLKPHPRAAYLKCRLRACTFLRVPSPSPLAARCVHCFLTPLPGTQSSTLHVWACRER